MNRDEFEHAFKALWARYQHSKMLFPSLDQIKEWALEKRLRVTNIQRRNVGPFHPVDCIVIETPEGKGCFPADPYAAHQQWERCTIEANRVAAIWEKLEWFSPLWISGGNVRKILKDAELLEPEAAIKSFNYHTSTIYTVHFEAVCIEQLMGAAKCVEDVRPLAREAFLAFYAGYKAASIAALIPAIEGAISKILPEQTHELPTMERVNRVIQGAIEYAAQIHYEGMWAPPIYKTADYLFSLDERVFCFETFRRWLQQSFYRNTKEYAGATSLNRHLFAHGISDEWQKASLSRLIVALATIGTIESWFKNDSSSTLFFPEPNEDSRLLHQQAILHGSVQMIVKDIEEATYHRSGKLTPELATDDGTLLRRANLMRDCIDDLVRPMREAGWNVEVQDDESDLYLIVIGKCRGEELRVALLYSCATDNDLYQSFAKECHAILYRGGPYKQDQFARGVKVHVGPVAGWRPPSPTDQA
ncbi:hypothetical protein [Pseudomonas oryzihabitans]|uniref:hypothetical protein n=1 Tax=Pseudomonas oryzihabitans TaxID=47885 RepID=UPI002420425A|nr:hypothetical protein [Pseudomonas oryzihabitans]